MRAYMYAFGYRSENLARDLLDSLDLPDHACEDCGACRIVCLNGWDIADKVREITALRPQRSTTKAR